MIFSINHYFKQDRKFLWFLSCLSLIIRLFFNYFFLADNPCQLMYDSAQYHAVATALTDGNGFTNPDQSPHFYRLPGYPIFLGTVYAIFGVNPVYAMIIQIIFSSLIPLLVYMLFLLFFPGAVLGARIAGLLASVHIGFLIFSGLVMTETFFLVFFLLFCCMFFSDDRSLFAGIFLGLASLFRPVGHYLVVVTLVLMVIRSQKIRNMLWLLAGWVFVVAPWLIRNVLLTGSLFFHSLSGPHFLNHGAVRVVMAHNKISYDQAKVRVINDYETLLSLQKVPLDEPMCSRIAEKFAFKIMCAHPVESIKLFVLNMLKTVFSLYSSELLMIDSRGSLPPYEHNRSFFGMLKKFLVPKVNNAWIIAVIYGEMLFFLLMLFATLHYLVGALFNRKRFLQILPIILFSALFVGLSCVCGFARLRITLEPFLLIFTAYFLYNVLVCFESAQIFCCTQSRR
jgi:hypothetical protein